MAKQASLVRQRKNSKILPSSVGVNQSLNTSHIIVQLMEDNAPVKMVISSMVSRMYQEPTA